MASQSPVARLDAVINQALAEDRIVGTVVIVRCDGQELFRRAAGFIDRERNIPMPTDAIFRLASTSKAIVSATALALVERGRLGLEDPVSRWLPRFAPRAPDGSRPAITVRELLTHTSGLDYPFWEPTEGPYRRAKVSSGMDQPGLSMDDELERINRAGLRFSPGTQWHYSLSIDVLGAVIAAAAGESLPDAVKRFVTGPLGLNDTGFAVRDAQRLAVPYYSEHGQTKRMADDQVVDFGDGVSITFNPHRHDDPRSFPSGGAGMVGTASELMHFLEAIRTGGAPILKPATVSQMTANQTREMTILSGPGWGFGFGAAVVTDPQAANTPLSQGSWSWSGAYGNSWFTDPLRKITAVAMTNTTPEGDSGNFALEIRQAVYAAAAAH